MIMLTLLAFGSLWAIIPVYIVLVCFEKENLLFESRPMSRPRLRVVVILVVLLAIDFAVLNRLDFTKSRVYSNLYASDAAVVLIPLIYGMLAKHSIGGLWILACVMGVLGGLMLPEVVVH
jgi:hypothetical protein